MSPRLYSIALEQYIFVNKSKGAPNIQVLISSFLPDAQGYESKSRIIPRNDGAPNLAELGV